MNTKKYYLIVEKNDLSQARYEYRINRAFDSYKYHVETKTFGCNSSHVIDWCENNCCGRFSVCWSVFIFKKQEDATLFQLTWIND